MHNKFYTNCTLALQGLRLFATKVIYLSRGINNIQSLWLLFNLGYYFIFNNDNNNQMNNESKMLHRVPGRKRPIVFAWNISQNSLSTQGGWWRSVTEFGTVK